MAEGVGADVDLATVPLKYPGLEPWEIWLSEAQERMVIAVPPDRLPELAVRCARHGVELADLGTFTGDGRLVVRHHGDVVLDLETAFLHDGRPRRSMIAELPAPARQPGRARRRRPGGDAAATAGPPEHRQQGGDHPPVRPRDRRRHRRAPARRCARRWAGGRCRAGRPSRRARPGRRHRRQPVVRAPRPRGDGPRRGRRGDPQRGGRRRRPGPRGAARQLLVGRPPPARDARRAGRRRRRLPRRRRRARRPVRVGQGLAEQRVHRGRRRPARRAADAGHHRRRPRRRRRPHGHPRAQRGRATSSCCSVARRRSSPAATSTSCEGTPGDPGMVPQPDPDAPARYRRLHRAIHDGLVRSCHDVSEGGLAVTLAELCIAGRLGIEVEVAARPRRHDVAVLRVDRPPGRRGPPRRPRCVHRHGRPDPPPRHRDQRPHTAFVRWRAR